MQPSFYRHEDSLGSELLCPSCGGNYLHHEHVEVFERGEDEEKGLHVLVTGGKTTVDTCIDGNPSKRRHGFTCLTILLRPVCIIRICERQ